MARSGHIGRAPWSLGEGAFEAAWAERHAMTLEEAVAYALEEDERKKFTRRSSGGDEV